MALRFSFFDRVLGISPQVGWLTSVEISRLGQYYSLARLMSSGLRVSGVRRCALRGSWKFRLSIPPNASNTSRLGTTAAAKRKTVGGCTMRPHGKTKLGFFPLPLKHGCVGHLAGRCRYPEASY